MRAIVLIDHGSRNAAANEVVLEVAARLRTSRGVYVAPAHMELAAPTIAEAIASCVAAGATEIVAVPYFLGPGRHATEDVPRLVREAAQANGIEVRVTEPFGADPLMVELVATRAGI